MSSDNTKKVYYFKCESRKVIMVLMFISGFFGGYTFLLRGGVFANAQTANLVLLAVQLGTGNIIKGLYYLVPIFSHFFGTIISEIIPKFVIKKLKIRWDTLFIFIEILVVVILGFLPDSLPVQISQVMISFTMALQHNTFRESEGTPISTTFCTNNLRLVGVNFARWLKKKSKKYIKNSLFYFGHIILFCLGALTCATLSKYFQSKCIFVLVIPLILILLDLLKSDIYEEKKLINIPPHGHSYDD